jgi:hypothetical protein
MDTSGAKIWLPGISDPATLETASMLCGDAAMREHGQDHHTRHPVLTPGMIRQLPAGRALVIRGGCAPVIARLPMCWKDHLYRRARRTGHAIAALTPITEPRPAALPTATWPHGLIPADPGTALPPGTSNGSGRPARYPWDQDEDERSA